MINELISLVFDAVKGTRMDTPKSRSPVLAELRFAERQRDFDGLDLAERFALIYHTNLWGAESSQSGLGSELDATSSLRRELSQLLKHFEVTTLLDLPCGDFTWMAQMDLGGITYVGADIVPDIIAANDGRYGRAGHIDFCQLDLVSDPLPAVDLVLCRDCLVHLSFANIRRAIANLKRSGSRWLLTTIFPDASANRDIEDGDWRVLNLQHAPFLFPMPEAMINEGCTEAGSDYADKSLALWRMADLSGDA
jgi:SAM-dependent methyltransferase